MTGDHDYAPRWTRLVTNDDHEIERGGRCYRCRSLHVTGMRPAQCGTSRGGVSIALGALALASVIAAVVSLV